MVERRMEQETSLTLWTSLLARAVVLLVGSVSGVSAEVTPGTMSGVPEMVIPQYSEQGAPTFVTPQRAPDLSASTAPPPTSGPSGAGGSDGGFIATAYNQYLGQAVGSGQCVALVQTANPSVGLTATWQPGASVQGNTSLQSGTVIATFGPNGTYTNSLDGSAHAAIYLGQNSEGIQVQDQWAGQVDHTRTIPWRGNSSGPAVNNGSKFYVVTHGA